MPGNPRPAVAGRLAHQEHRGTPPRLEVRGEARRRSDESRVLVEGRPDPGGRERIDERYDAGSVNGELGQPG